MDGCRCALIWRREMIFCGDFCVFENERLIHNSEAKRAYSTVLEWCWAQARLLLLPVEEEPILLIFFVATSVTLRSFSWFTAIWSVFTLLPCPESLPSRSCFTVRRIVNFKQPDERTKEDRESEARNTVTAKCSEEECLWVEVGNQH